MTTKKMGRPTNNPRRTSIHFRISESEKELITNVSEMYGKSRIDTILDSVKILERELKKEVKNTTIKHMT